MLKGLKFAKVVEAILATIISTIGSFFLQEEKLFGEEALDSGEVVIALFTFSIIVVSIYLMANVVSIIDLYLSKIKRKYFSANYIEGQWYQVIHDEMFNEITDVTKFSVLDISLEDGGFTIKGRSHSNIDGINTTQFHSAGAKYDKEKDSLEYFFGGITDEKGESSNFFGQTKISFIKSSGSRVFDGYSGTVSSDRRRNVKVKAMRINKDWLKKLELDIKDLSFANDSHRDLIREEIIRTVSSA